MTPTKKTALIILLAIPMSFGVFLYVGWYQWAENSETPYDEVGIEINSYLPAPMQKWACGRIAERFPGTLPPYTCDKKEL